MAFSHPNPVVADRPGAWKIERGSSRNHSRDFPTISLLYVLVGWGFWARGGISSPLPPSEQAAAQARGASLGKSASPAATESGSGDLDTPARGCAGGAADRERGGWG